VARRRRRGGGVSNAASMTGGCQCGRVRYAARIDSDAAYLCHCGMCRRATGAVSVAFHNLKKTDVVWTGAAPDYYQSSLIARRGFCSACGTPLTFDYPDSDMMDLTIGSFDDPGRFVPDHHFSPETMLPHWRDTASLPGIRLDENAATVRRWMDATGKLPE
jgi:hypothetical protein